MTSVGRLEKRARQKEQDRERESREQRERRERTSRSPSLPRAQEALYALEFVITRPDDVKTASGQLNTVEAFHSQISLHYSW